MTLAIVVIAGLVDVFAGVSADIWWPPLGAIASLVLLREVASHCGVELTRAAGGRSGVRRRRGPARRASWSGNAWRLRSCVLAPALLDKSVEKMRGRSGCRCAAANCVTCWRTVPRPCCSAARHDSSEARCSSAVVRSLLLVVLLTCALYFGPFGPGLRIGEASNPGPGLLDNPDADPFHDLEMHLAEVAAELPDAAWVEPPMPGVDPVVSVNAPDFESAFQFRGARAGFVFKLGKRGLG